MHATNKIKQQFHWYLKITTVESLSLKIGIIFFILLFFITTDLLVRNNRMAFYTRLAPMFLSVVILMLQIKKDRWYTVKFTIYNLALTSLIIMMLGKCVVHLYDGGLNSCVMGTILVIFLVSLDLNTKLISTLLIYTVPVFFFCLIMIFRSSVTKEQWLTISNIFPIIIIGFTINRLQLNLRFKAYEKGRLLELEKNKVEKLYLQTLNQNTLLQEQKQKISQQSADLIQHKEQLDTLNSTKDKLLSIITHDLKNPANAIIGFSKLLNEHIKCGRYSEMERFSQGIHHAATQSLILLDNLLNWSALESGKLLYKPEPVLLGPLLKNVFHLYDINIQQKEIGFKLICPNNLEVFVDPLIMEVIMRNLLSNAIKFTPEKGKISIIAQQQQHFFTVEVNDSGIGIDEEKQKELFSNKFSTKLQGENGEPGTGLGLHLCKEFVELHKGTIIVKSMLNNGSTFIISIPKK